MAYSAIFAAVGRVFCYCLSQCCSAAVVKVGSCDEDDNKIRREGHRTAYLNPFFGQVGVKRAIRAAGRRVSAAYKTE